jgi:hypothetical protein
VGGWRRFGNKRGCHSAHSWQPYSHLQSWVLPPNGMWLNTDNNVATKWSSRWYPEGLGRCLVSMTSQRPSVCLTPLIQATVRVRVKTHKANTTWSRGDIHSGNEQKWCERVVRGKTKTVYACVCGLKISVRVDIREHTRPRTISADRLQLRLYKNTLTRRATYYHAHQFHSIISF